MQDEVNEKTMALCIKGGKISAQLLKAALTLSLIHISEPTRRTPISYAVFCLKKKKKETHQQKNKNNSITKTITKSPERATNRVV